VREIYCLPEVSVCIVSWNPIADVGIYLPLCRGRLLLSIRFWPHRILEGNAAASAGVGIAKRLRFEAFLSLF
jgi:hypothetical protein